MKNANKRRRKFKRVVSSEKVDWDRVEVVQLTIDPNVVDLVMKQGCLKLRRTATLNQSSNA